MSHNVLLEIGLEEMPANVITQSRIQLMQRIEKFLTENRLAFGEVNSYATPRRLAVLIHDVAEKQKDEEVTAKGPAKKIALDDNGEWTKAAQGFVRGQGLRTEDIYLKEIKGIEYVHVDKFVPGKKAMDILVNLSEVITAMTFPVSMHWANYSLKYIRPIHWIAALADDQVIPFKVLDIETSNTSRGHRFLGTDVEFKDALDYENALREEFVIASNEERSAMIVEQINTLAAEHQWTVPMDDDLLEEVTNIVEYPTAFYGTFDEAYLSLPNEVLITSMKDHQRYFYVMNEENNLMSYFISVRNGNAEHIENVAKGNEKVLVARLDDANFFFEEDKKLTIENCLEKLKSVTFHEKVGSMFNKMQRVGLFAEVIGKQIGLAEQELTDLKRAAAIYKFDLVTNMVDEFPELQGIMGEKYALLFGENEAVAHAIREHYQPISSEGELPTSDIGAILAIADKLDSVMSLFAAGVIPTGSNDPFGLRRQAYGMIRIIVDKQWTFHIRTIWSTILSHLEGNATLMLDRFKETDAEALSFIKGRVRQLLNGLQLNHDVIDAALDSTQDDIIQVIETAQVLAKESTTEDFKPTIEAISRALNLASKANEGTVIKPERFETTSEKNLYDNVLLLKDHYAGLTIAEKYTALADLAPIINAFFDENMVMAEDSEIRDNRLSILRQIADFTLSFASLDKLVIK
ncbi:glycine--tRNA ligase subunit beta [Desemzia sp. RIT804]|uniref:glycine--tRNA ligase subunit beta n=1 Tax=Desemzia sp. RIT 804 TaxID=2810209 RepID=UPI001951CBE4|nr:glycine--tRNA ligase subunit beta [Desemzia sp. RIT 804]MBM6613865.1 glycine--tRNA ligase subunit beta [Desemzia sp. RIT 804]